VNPDEAVVVVAKPNSINLNDKVEETQIWVPAFSAVTHTCKLTTLLACQELYFDLYVFAYIQTCIHTYILRLTLTFIDSYFSFCVFCQLALHKSVQYNYMLNICFVSKIISILVHFPTYNNTIWRYCFFHFFFRPTCMNCATHAHTLDDTRQVDDNRPNCIGYCTALDYVLLLNQIWN